MMGFWFVKLKLALFLIVGEVFICEIFLRKMKNTERIANLAVAGLFLLLIVVGNFFLVLLFQW